MFSHCRLAIVILVLTLHDQGFAGRIIGGHEAKPHSRPYMVLLEKYTSKGPKKFCGGFLLSEDLVMTAAHCQAKSYTVKLGLHNLNAQDAGVQSITVEQSFPHEKYSESGYINDIMLLKLSTKAKFNEKVAPIELASQDNGYLPKSCTISGWGRHNNITMMSPVLMEVNVTLTDNKNCAKKYFYCSEGETGMGEGDSGGPLVCEGGLVYGVMSSLFEPNSGGPQLQRFAKVSDHRRWITSTIAKALREI